MRKELNAALKSISKPWFLLTLFGPPALLMTLDNACSPVSNQFCSQWLQFQWETVLAGLYGLGGGYLALTAVKWQDKNQQRRIIQTCRNEIAELQIMIGKVEHDRDTIFSELSHALEICNSIQNGRQITPSDEHHVDFVVKNTPKEILRLTTKLIEIQEIAAQISQDFKTVITLMIRVGITRHLNSIPVGSYRDANQHIANFENVDFENGQRTSVSTRLAKTHAQLSYMHKIVNNINIGDLYPAKELTKKAISQLNQKLDEFG